MIHDDRHLRDRARHGKWVVPRIYGALARRAGRAISLVPGRAGGVGCSSPAVDLFALHVGFDEFLPGLHLLEDGFRFLGIVLWATFFVGAGLVAVKDRVTRGP